MRDSSLPRYKFVLSTYYNNYATHFSILQHMRKEFFSIDQEKAIEGLDELIKFYQHNDDDFLGVRLSSFAFVKGDLPPAEFCKFGKPPAMKRSDCDSVKKIVMSKFPGAGCDEASKSTANLISDSESEPAQSSPYMQMKMFKNGLQGESPTVPCGKEPCCGPFGYKLVQKSIATALNEDFDGLFIEEGNLEISAQLLSDGHFGTVFKGILVLPGTSFSVAIKTLHKNHNASDLCDFLREAATMMRLNNPYIVKFIGVVKGPPMRIVQEYQPLGSLSNFLQKHGNEVTADDVHVWATQISAGMECLEKKRFIHRNLKARNVLLTTMKHAKISDFSLSRTISLEHSTFNEEINEKM